MPPSPPRQSATALGSLRTLAGWDALILLLAVATLLAPLACRLAQAHPGAEPTPGAHPDHDMRGMAGMAEDGAEHSHATRQAAASSMAHEHMAMGAHMKMTAPRPPSAADEKRAAEIVRVLRAAVDKYRDYRVAIADGYQPFLPQIPQPMYHFTNWVHGFQEAFSFDPERPTSLLYEKTPDGYRLKGAMYTTPKGMSEEELDSRVPLSVTSWHQHVNICLPKKGQGKTADWTKFGFAGSLATADDCAAAGGDFHPVIFGWMVHVYPFETERARIWAH